MTKIVTIVDITYKIVMVVFIINILIKNKILMLQFVILKNLHVHQHNKKVENLNL